MNDTENRKAMLKNAEFIVSEGNYGFEKVLESLPRAKYIYIITYNIDGSKESKVLNMLKNEVRPDCNLFFVTNVPPNFVKGMEKTIETKFEMYLSYLDPQSFNCNANVYFNFANHGKLIMTDEIAYVGSANYTDFGKDNIELGIIIRDHDSLQVLRENAERIIHNSSPYYSDEKDIAKVMMLEKDILSITNWLIDLADRHESWEDENNFLIGIKPFEWIEYVLSQIDELFVNVSQHGGFQYNKDKHEIIADMDFYADNNSFLHLEDNTKQLREYVKNISEVISGSKQEETIVKLIDRINYSMKKVIDDIVCYCYEMRESQKGNKAKEEYRKHWAQRNKK